MTWAQRLKWVFGIDVEICHQCGGVIQIIASIEDPVVVAKILSHLFKKNKVPDSSKPARKSSTPTVLPVLINDHELSISKLVNTTAGDLCFLLLNFENSLLRCENYKIFNVNRDKKLKILIAMKKR
jgi:hypothetical protein